MADLVGQSLGRYHILEQLGEGGMATVYKAYDTRLEADVAVKVIRTEALPQNAVERALKRFEREAKALARLTHPNIVKVMDYGEYEGKPYLVMPFLPGGTLKQHLGKPWPWRDAVQLLTPIAEALAYAHEHEIIHRDIKPSNILITEKGQPMLSDFGVAKLLDLEETQELTATGVGVGTPEYMAPEQASSRVVDGRADIYSLGVVLYEMVTGCKPYIADTPMAVLIMHARDSLPRPKSHVPDLPQEVENILLKALAKDPRERYEDMGCFAEALEGLLNGKVKAVGAARQVQPALRNSDNAREMQEQRKVPAIEQRAKARRPRGTRLAIGLGLIGVLAALGLVWLGTVGRGGPSALFPTKSPTLTFTPSLTSTPTPTSTPTRTATPKVTPTPVLQIGSMYIRPADEMTMLYVPAGPFTMGSNYNYDDEKPKHAVTLDAFWIDKTEVTNAMYAKCVRAGDCLEPKSGGSRTRDIYYRSSQYGDYPVVWVDWYDANTYCTWAGGQLPTEAEWEKAARGVDGRTYPWGEGIDCSLANYFDYYGRGYCESDTTAVGSYPRGASPYGALDMAGNVWEWVADWYDADYYSTSPQSNPLGPSSGDKRVLRGGSGYGSGNYARASLRKGFAPSYVIHGLGFRCSLGTLP